MSNPLDRWPVEVCGKCGGRTCQACSTELKLQALMGAIEQQLTVIAGLTKAVGQATDRLLDLDRRLAQVEFNAKHKTY
jgi:hypothetical protein